MFNIVVLQAIKTNTNVSVELASSLLDKQIVPMGVMSGMVVTRLTKYYLLGELTGMHKYQGLVSGTIYEKPGSHMKTCVSETGIKSRGNVITPHGCCGM